jgi:hypothetical protein
MGCIWWVGALLYMYIRIEYCMYAYRVAIS